MGADTVLRLRPRPVAPSLDVLLGDALATRRPFETNEVRSTSAFEAVDVGGDRRVLKRIELDHDFTMRATGDIGCRPLRAYGAGLFDLAPDLIDHAVLGAAAGVGRNGWGGAFLMRDVSADLVPPGDAPLPPDQHERFLDHLTGLCARTWGWQDDLGLLPYGARWLFFSPSALDGERALGWPEAVPSIAARGWEQFAERAPADVGRAVDELRRDLAPLVDALRTTPSCFLHGDWKAANLGTAPDGRTVLIDWAYVGEGPACHELGWYVALNAAKLPAPKEDVIGDFRAGLERHDVDTGPWWDVQLDLALLGTLVQFGWEKGLGDGTELGWWCDRARAGLDRL